MKIREMAVACLVFGFVTVGGLPAKQSAPATSPQPIESLSLEQAEQIALKNHPQIQAAVNLASAAKAEETENRSAYLPTVTGSLTGVEAENDSRIASGGLNNPVIYDRYANGVSLSQLVTDFGRTHELVKSSSLHAQAQQEDVVTSRADVLLQVDQAYFAVLRAQAVLQVAQQTVKDRKLVADQVTVLEQNKIKSGLDVSFAKVDLAQANLLLIQAQNDLQASFAALSTALGYPDERTFQLTEVALPSAPPPDFAPLLSEAMQNRPELLSQRLEATSAHSYATAERDLRLPTVSAVGAAGLTPVTPSGSPLAPRYAAAGVNVNIPLLHGRLYSALESEANSRALAQDQYLRDLQNRIARDVRKAWLDSNSAWQRLAATQQLLDEANQAFDLAQSRYKLGLSSIVEMSQAQLNQTQAQIQQASAKYDYEQQTSVLNYELGRLK